MSVHIWSKVWKLDLKPSPKLVLLKIADCADENGRNAFPAVLTIASETGFSKRTVQRRLKEFVDSGVLVVERYMKGGRRPRHYRIDLKRAQELHSFPPSEGIRGDNNCHPRNDTSDAEGCQSLSPEPSLTVNEQKERSHFVSKENKSLALNLWNSRLEDLISHFGENVFNQWLEPITPIADNGTTITLAVPTQFILDQVCKYLCELEGLLDRKVSLIR